MSATAGMSNGVRVRFTTVLEPSGQSSDWRLAGGGISVKTNLVHRYFWDEQIGIYFGYDLDVMPLPDHRKFLVAVKPLSLGWEKLKGPGPQPLAHKVLPAYPRPQTLQDAETLALDVLVNPRTDQKIVDRIQLSRGALPAGPMRTQGPPRDFALDDVELKLTGPVLLINGVEAARDDSFGLTGAVLWFSLPDRGRFLLSIHPHAGYRFEQAGVIQGKVLKFRAGGDEYELRSTSPILVLDGQWNLYVLRDLTYPGAAPRSTKPGQDFVFGATDRVEFLISGR